MFEGFVKRKQDKRVVILGYALLIIFVVIIFIFEMLTGCEHQTIAYDSFYCKPKQFLEGDYVPTGFTDITLQLEDADFNFYNQSLTFNVSQPYNLNMMINGNNYGYTSFSADVYIGGSLMMMEKTGLPDTGQAELWSSYIDMIAPNRTQATYIYWDTDENICNVSYTDTPDIICDPAIIQNMITTDLQRIFSLTTIAVSYTCTSCFSVRSPKFNNFLLVITGIFSLGLAAYKIITYFLIRDLFVEHQQVPILDLEQRELERHELEGHDMESHDMERQNLQRHF
jgi:hypothetical protein